MPAWFLKGLLGERAALLLGGQRISSVKINALDYEFAYPELKKAILSLL
jgi:NAD dependent epimerase/dehydratase family enzyme